MPADKQSVGVGNLRKPQTLRYALLESAHLFIGQTHRSVPTFRFGDALTTGFAEVAIFNMEEHSIFKKALFLQKQFNNMETKKLNKENRNEISFISFIIPEFAAAYKMAELITCTKIGGLCIR